MSILPVIGNHVHFSDKDRKTSVTAKVTQLSSELGKGLNTFSLILILLGLKVMTENPSFSVLVTEDVVGCTSICEKEKIWCLFSNYPSWNWKVKSI